MAAGLFVGWVWMIGSEDVAFAVTAVVVCLVAVLLSSPGWRHFGIALGVLAALAGGGLVVLVWSARR